MVKCLVGMKLGNLMMVKGIVRLRMYWLTCFYSSPHRLCHKSHHCHPLQNNADKNNKVLCTAVSMSIHNKILHSINTNFFKGQNKVKLFQRMWSLLFNLKNLGTKSGLICNSTFLENLETMSIVIVPDFKDSISTSSN